MKRNYCCMNILLNAIVNWVFLAKAKLKEKLYLNEEYSDTRLTFISPMFFLLSSKLGLQSRHLHTLYFSNIIFKTWLCGLAGIVFLRCLVRFAGFHYVLNTDVKIYDFISFFGKRVIWRSFNGAKKCIACVWYWILFALN